jgi:hypothetical protein
VVARQNFFLLSRIGREKPHFPFNFYGSSFENYFHRSLFTRSSSSSDEQGHEHEMRLYMCVYRGVNYYLNV